MDILQLFLQSFGLILLYLHPSRSLTVLNTRPNFNPINVRVTMLSDIVFKLKRVLLLHYNIALFYVICKFKANLFS